MADWQKIETAPKDGTRILAYDFADADDTQPQIVLWSTIDGKEGWYVSWDHTPLDGSLWNPPTHWQPLPSPPAED